MWDTDLYQRILGLEKSWFVKRVDLQVAENRVDIWLEHPGGAKWPCPKCGQELPCRDHAEERALWISLLGAAHKDLPPQLGGIWTLANSRPTFMPGFWNAR